MLILTRNPGESIKIEDDSTNFLNTITKMPLSINLSITLVACENKRKIMVFALRILCPYLYKECIKYQLIPLKEYEVTYAEVFSLIVLLPFISIELLIHLIC